MATLSIALLGASHSSVQPLADALQQAVNASGWQARVVLAVMAGTPARQADLAGMDLALLTGLEPLAQAQDEKEVAADRSIRAQLAQTARPYQVLYGTNSERVARALGAIEALLPAASGARRNAASSPVRNQPWVWACDKCSDPGCEHRLLTALLTQRAAVA